MNKLVGVIGAGTMGSGIAQVFAQKQIKVIVVDAYETALRKAESRLLLTLDKLVEKKKYSREEADRIFSNIEWSQDITKLSDAYLIIEAIVEHPEVKKEMFQKLSDIVNEECILASNTSSLSITSIASAYKIPEKFIGIHFFNPAPLMKLVEIIPAVQTDSDTLKKAKEIIDALDKVTVVVKDTPGFIVNKVARPFYSESIKMLEERSANTGMDAQILKIDTSLKAAGFRMGPFELTDLIGHDVNYTVTETVWKSFYYDPRYRPSLTQKRLVEANWFGKKSGKGFYDYSKEPKTVEVSEGEQEEIVRRVVCMIINEAADTVFQNIASVEDIDRAMKSGVNYPKGPFEWADEMGLDTCVHTLDSLYEIYGDDRYRTCPLLRKYLKQNKKFYS